MKYGTLSADIVQSTSLTVDDTKRLHQYLDRFLSEMQELYPNRLWGRLVKGDEIELVTDSPNDVFRIALMLKCYVKAFVPNDEVGRDFRKFGVRIALGVGSLRINDDVTGVMDGEAIYFSGRGLSRLAGAKSNLSFAMSDAGLSDAVNTICVLVSDLLDGATQKQCQVLYWKLRGKNETEIAGILGVSQPTVNKMSASASWHSLGKALGYYENINF